MLHGVVLTLSPEYETNYSRLHLEAVNDLIGSTVGGSRTQKIGKKIIGLSNQPQSFFNRND